MQHQLLITTYLVTCPSDPFYFSSIFSSLSFFFSLFFYSFQNFPLISRKTKEKQSKPSPPSRLFPLVCLTLFLSSTFASSCFDQTTFFLFRLVAAPLTPVVVLAEENHHSLSFASSGPISENHHLQSCYSVGSHQKSDL